MADNTDPAARIRAKMVAAHIEFDRLYQTFLWAKFLNMVRSKPMNAWDIKCQPLLVTQMSLLDDVGSEGTQPQTSRQEKLQRK